MKDIFKVITLIIIKDPLKLMRKPSIRKWKGNSPKKYNQMWEKTLSRKESEKNKFKIKLLIPQNHIGKNDNI
jgi:hypothetical protein